MVTRLKVIVAVVLACAASQQALGQAFNPPFGLGDHAVGHQRIDLPGNPPRHADVWYPVDRPNAAGNFAAYPLRQGDNFLFPSMVAIASAPVADEQHPLVVLYHGSGGTSTLHYAYNELLASHGFVVMAPQTTSNVDLTINVMLNADTDPSSPFFQRIDEGKIATAGQSAGAATAELIAHRDDRVGAVISISTSGATRALAKPTLLFSGTKDHLRPSINFDFDRRAAIPRYLVTMENANHGSYFDACNWLEYARANSAPASLIATLQTDAGFICADDLIDPVDAIELTAFYSVAFLKAHVLQNREYETFLTSAFAEANNLPLELDAVVPEPATIVLLLMPLTSSWALSRRRH
jgi:predicted dienelactone hydrolase